MAGAVEDRVASPASAPAVVHGCERDRLAGWAQQPFALATAQ